MNRLKIILTLTMVMAMMALSSCKEKDTIVDPGPINGNPAPGFSLESSDGTIRALSDLKGSVVVVDFWASWCSYCKAENPNVVAFYNRYHDQGLEVLAISIDQSKEAWKNAISEQQLPYLHVIDTEAWSSQVVANYGVSSIPHLVLIDREGNIIATADQVALLETKLLNLLNSGN